MYYKVQRNRYALKEKKPDLQTLLSGEASEDSFREAVFQKGYSTTTRKVQDKEYDSRKMAQFVRRVNGLNNRLYNTSYTEHRIPKKSGGIRVLHEPNGELKKCQKGLMKALKEFTNGGLHHTAAYAYTQQRNCKKAIEVHQGNKSRWFLKLDIHDFFGSTTKAFIDHMFDIIDPLCSIGTMARISIYRMILFNGVLPQGAPTSPMITNLIMIPIDYEITKVCRENNLVYTRYADDILISGKEKFDWQKMIQEIEDIFTWFGAPYELNREKTRFGSSAGRNWNLGLMYNKDGNITVGHEKKKQWKAMLTTYCVKPEDIDIGHFIGITSYYRSIEKNYVDYVIDKYAEKFNKPDLKKELFIKE